MNWKRGKQSYLIGYEDGKQNGYTIKRRLEGWQVLYTAMFRGKPLLSDTSSKLAQQAAEAHQVPLHRMPEPEEGREGLL